MAENFNLIFGSNAPDTTTWTDADYQTGWSTVGSTPPTAEQFDFLQNRADLKAKELNDTLTPLVQKDTDNYRQPDTAYSIGDIRLNTSLPAGWYLECTTAGTSDSADLVITSPNLGDTVSDGTVVWTINSALNLIGGGALTGSSLTWNADDLGSSAIVSSDLSGSHNQYVKYANGLIIQGQYVTLNQNATSVELTFPLSFSDTRYMVVASFIADQTISNIEPINVYPTDKTKCKVNVKAGHTTINHIQVIAIGT